MSLQEAGIKGKILCSLGVSNIKNYQPQTNERSIIAADNDGLSAPSLKAVHNAKATLEQQDALVSVVTPKKSLVILMMFLRLKDQSQSENY
ncbi:hypothetical protein [Candidatus Tisiphia endosymbiont of Nemotelus uliginosus]|uniref:hypothetical protein n=1 Tax=Candidatus Tisiphia endosymbiont of Nemotelus uliginosus TaxID=3077926 RepID=UPI0035C8F60E